MSLSVTSDKENMARFGVLKLTLSIFDFAVNCSYVILILYQIKNKKNPWISVYICVYQAQLLFI